MDQKWFASSVFVILCFLNLSDFLFVSSYALLNSGETNNEIDPSILVSGGDQSELNQVLLEYPWKNLKTPNDGSNGEPSEENLREYRKWLNVLTFDKLYNLTKKEKGPQNETRVIFINTEDHLKIFENDDEEEEEEEEEDKTDVHLEKTEKNIFHLLRPEGFLNQIISEGQSKSLERAKRQAENEENEKKKCRCRRKRRRGMARRRRRRRRRNRAGQQQTPARRRRRRRGRRRNGRRRGNRRCVCRKKGEEDGKSGEEPEVEEADGEEEETTEGDENATEKDEGEENEEGGEEESDGEESDGKNEEDEEEEEEEEGEGEEGSDEEKDKESEDAEAKKNPSPANGGMSPASGPTYVFYPNMMETPVMMMPNGGIPVGSFPTRPVATYKIPS